MSKGWNCVEFAEYVIQSALANAEFANREHTEITE